ncbi:hypothetical protein [Haladaptatus sp. W1]|nr:hypothetical protein [Haladaptatus sp. W1]
MHRNSDSLVSSGQPFPSLTSIHQLLGHLWLPSGSIFHADVPCRRTLGS